MTLIETCQAIIDGSEDLFNTRSPNHKLHINNLKLLEKKGVVYFYENKFNFTKETIKEYIDNNGLTRSEKFEQDRDIREKETLAIAKKSAYYSKLALIISILALFCAIIPLFRNQ